jgi:hypothetical protein
MQCRNLGHFFAAAARSMQQIRLTADSDQSGAQEEV